MHPLLQLPPVQNVPASHVFLVASYQHPCASCAHVTCVEPLLHALAAPWQSGSTVHVHAADPAAPSHVWWTLGHVTGAPYAQQPLLPRVHVASPPEMHAVGALWLQLSVHVAAHAALGATPEHEPGAQLVVFAT